MLDQRPSNLNEQNLPGSIQDSQEISCKSLRHSVGNCLNFNKVEGNEEAQKEEERGTSNEKEVNVLERFQEDLQLESSRFAWKTRLDSNSRDRHKTKNHEAEHSHCPTEADRGDEVRCHDREYDASQSATGSHDTESKASFLEKPGWDCTCARLENTVQA